MSVIFSELLEDYFLSNINSDIFEDDKATEDEQVDESKYQHRAPIACLKLTLNFQIL